MIKEYFLLDGILKCADCGHHLEYGLGVNVICGM